jgi:DNA-binding Lrp family transcriptional regulator
MKFEIDVKELTLLTAALESYVDDCLERAETAQKMIDTIASAKPIVPEVKPVEEVIGEYVKADVEAVKDIYDYDRKLARNRERAAKRRAKDPNSSNHLARRWEPEEDNKIMNDKRPIRIIARELGRSESACYIRRSHLASKGVPRKYKEA